MKAVTHIHDNVLLLVAKNTFISFIVEVLILIPDSSHIFEVWYMEKMVTNQEIYRKIGLYFSGTFTFHPRFEASTHTSSWRI